MSTFTLLMGAVYLTYSAYYVSFSIENMRMFMNFILNILYLALFVVVARGTLDTRSQLRSEVIVAGEGGNL